MVVCKYFLQGNCRFGGESQTQISKPANACAELVSDNCRNEHPSNTGGRFGSQNRFGALANSSAGNDCEFHPVSARLAVVLASTFLHPRVLSYRSVNRYAAPLRGGSAPRKTTIPSWNQMRNEVSQLCCTGSSGRASKCTIHSSSQRGTTLERPAILPGGGRDVPVSRSRKSHMASEPRRSCTSKASSQIILEEA